MSLAAVPPLKATRPYDLQTPIAAWLDEDDAVYGTVSAVTGGAHHPPKPHFRSMEVSQDLAKLQRLRTAIVQVLISDGPGGGSSNYQEAAEQLDTFYEYHASLLQCEQHGICVEEVSSPLELPWSSAFAAPGNIPPAAARANPHGDDDDDDDAMDIDGPGHYHRRGGGRGRRNSSQSSGMEIRASITWERVNILWNIVALEAYLASTQPLTTRQGWMKAAVHLEKGAGILRHLRQDILLADAASSSSSQQSPFTTIDLSVAFCRSWESLLTAEAQRSSYEAFRCAARPRHFMLAKLATAAAPLYSDCEQSCGHDELMRRGAAGGDGNSSAGGANPILLRQFLGSWQTYAGAWGVWMRTKAEHHQGCVHRDKRQLGLELARLHKALTLGGQCQELCQQQVQQQQHPQSSSQPPSLQALAHEVKQTVDEMQSRYVQATQEQAQARAENNSNNNSHATVQPEDLPEIAPQLQVKVNQPIEKILPPLETPLFEDIMNPLVRRYVDLFMSEMDKLLFQMTSIAEEKTESARKALATVNLPHSLTAYRQEQAGGGIPEDLWFRVEAVQQEKRVSRLKQELWELRDIADAARHTYKVIKNQLEEDLAMDRLFREQHPNFEGHDAGEVQKTFRQSLENYDRLLVTAQDGDAVLLRRLEMLDTDPKYKLLQFQKSQLDRLLPGAGMVGPAIDTSLLSKLLVELSVLFREREMILSTMREELKNFDIHSRLSEVDLSGAAAANTNGNTPSGNGGGNAEAEREFRRILIESKESFNEIAYDIQENINKQTELVQTILVQNQKFMDARDAMQSSSSSDSCIVMIEDAIEEIDQLSKHLKEGKDFYDVVIPKLDKLKLQVGDVSARLTVERCEYEDNCRRNEQEAEDARMAASFMGNSGGNGNSGGDGGDGGHNNHAVAADPRRGSDRPTRAQAPPGVEHVSHSVPQVRVDDEKVASLVAMDFDPEKVVEALKKYDNNVEQALNELLSC
ncbi:Programmed cell death 6-interacting [Seminavis robusta]|uniref:Programmed cell death 6-interacting n=1 Tax=Seminavis robusta TaxID=568900 RepID=A0A9N8DQD8_9STRA|nr:Programmed cell death 6-interacting [Seminavis robusta]|eukprot:Sro272_g104890.1 Programmed cell death 6-interacting (976) ;mRNA; f:49884-52811